MRPLSVETRDLRSLQDVGMASIQIVHDLKNQLNGLKLYATFIRKRLETSERPPDELEAIAKLIAGLERTAAELTTLVRYGRPIELRTQPSVPLAKILSSINGGGGTAEQIRIEMDDGLLEGEFDVLLLTEALQAITNGALGMRKNGNPLLIHQRLDASSESPFAVIEWRDIQSNESDVFRSLASSDALRMSLAARVIEAHNGKAEQEAGMLRVSLPINKREE